MSSSSAVRAACSSATSAVGTDADVVPSSDAAHQAPPAAATAASPPTTRKPRREGGGWGSGPCGKGRSSMAQQVSQSRYPDQRDTTKAKLKTHDLIEQEELQMPPARANATAQHLLEVLAPVVSATGHDLEDVTVTSAGRRSLVRVVVDADGGVDLDAVAEVSRVVSEALDA